VDGCQSRLDKARKRQLVADTRSEPADHTGAARYDRAEPVTLSCTTELLAASVRAGH